MRSAFLLFFVISFVSAGAQENFLQKKSFTFKLANPDTLLSVMISNKSAHSEELFFKLNGKFYYTAEDILKDIKKYYKEVTPLSILKFISSNVLHQTPLNQSTSIYNPLVIMNSLGLGLCSQKAVLMSILCKMSGYSSKVVFLKNHVICYVENNGRKELYDPDYGILLLNKKSGEILTLDSLKTLNFDDYYLYDDSGFKQYTNYYTDHYRSCYKKYEVKDSLRLFYLNHYTFTVPPGSNLVFPVALSSDTVLDKVNYAFAKLTLPDGFSGKISNPFIIYMIKGNCTVSFDSSSLILPDHEKSMKDLLYSCNSSFEIEIKNCLGEVVIYYLINNRFSSFYKVNNLELFVNDTSAFDVTLIPASNKTVYFSFSSLDKYMPEIKTEVSRIKSEFPQYSQTKLAFIDDMVKLATELKLIPDDKNSYDSFERKMKKLVRYSGYDFRELSFFLKYIESFVAYVVAIRSMNESEIIVFSGYLNNARKK